MNTRIVGTAFGYPINITITSPLDGKESAIFCADFYKQLASELPEILNDAEKKVPFIANAAIKLNATLEKIAKGLIK